MVFECLSVKCVSIKASTSPYPDECRVGQRRPATPLRIVLNLAAKSLAYLGAFSGSCIRSCSKRPTRIKYLQTQWKHSLPKIHKPPLTFFLATPLSQIHSGASISLDPMKHCLLFMKIFLGKVLEKNFIRHFPKKFPLYPSKFLMIFLVIDHYFQIVRFPGYEFPISYYPLLFPPFLFNFPLFFKLPSSFRYSYTEFSFLPKMFYISFPPKLTKTFVPPKMPNFLPKMGMRKISVSFPP